MKIFIVTASVFLLLINFFPTDILPEMPHNNALILTCLCIGGGVLIMIFMAVFIPKSCPNCKEDISRTATKCPFCRTDMSFRVKK